MGCNKKKITEMTKGSAVKLCQVWVCGGFGQWAAPLLLDKGLQWPLAHFPAWEGFDDGERCSRHTAQKAVTPKGTKARGHRRALDASCFHPMCGRAASAWDRQSRRLEPHQQLK